MAFIRDYAAASGDPFRLRRPKWARRFKPGRSLRALAPGALGLVPGLGSAMEFARGYGLMAGDPGNKRKAAASGPKHKAQKKAEHRASKAGGHHQPAADKRRGRGPSWWERHQEALGGLSDIGASIGRRFIPGVSGIQDLTGTGPELAALAGHGLRLGGHHRKRNFANVKALRGAIRRVEGFEKLVKSVERAYPRMRHAHAPRAQARGHKRGCKCVACR